MKYVSISIALSAFFCSQSARGCQSDLLASARGIPWHEAIDFSATEQLLRTSPPRRVMSMASYLQSRGFVSTGESESYFVDFGERAYAIFKPEGEPWDSAGEVGAYRFSQWLGVKRVPPTVYRTLQWPALWSGQRKGSLQWIVESEQDTAARGLVHWKQSVGGSEWSRVVSILYPLGQWDFYSGNLVVDSQGATALIDNAAIMDFLWAEYGDFPFIFRGALPHADASSILRRAAAPAAFLVRPSAEDLLRQFAGYFGRRAAERWANLSAQFHEGKLHYIEWEGTLWLYRPKGSAGPLRADCYIREIVERLRQLDKNILEELLPPPFVSLHHELILRRVASMLQVAGAGPWCNELADEVVGRRADDVH